jgi:hypothetical protein
MLVSGEFAVGPGRRVERRVRRHGSVNCSSWTRSVCSVLARFTGSGRSRNLTVNGFSSYFSKEEWNRHAGCKSNLTVQGVCLLPTQLEISAKCQVCARPFP